MFNWFSFLTYVVISAATPGPNNIMSMANGTQYGFRKALPFNFGVWAGFTVLMLLSAVFCSLLAAYVPMIELPMLIVGAVYMLYLAWKTLRSAPGAETGRANASFVTGMLLQFVNPKLYLYGIMSMEAYILPVYAGQPLTLMLFALFLAFAGFFFTLCWSLFGSVFQRAFTRHAKLVNAVMALLLVYCAISLFL